MAAVSMAPHPVHRPSMDRSTSSESSRRQFTSTYERPNSPISRQTYAPSPLSNHSRTNSNASQVSSPYAQPYPPAFFAQPSPHPSHPHAHGGAFAQQYPFPQKQIPNPHNPHNTAWTATPIPVSAFYPTPPMSSSASTTTASGQGGLSYSGQVSQVFHPGFQQSQADFAAWAHAAAYQHMVMASVQQQQHYQQHQLQQQEILEEQERRRTTSGPAHVPAPHPSDQTHQQQQHHQSRRPSLDGRSVPTVLQQPRSVSDKVQSQQQLPGGFHPYKRAPGHRPSRENVRAAPQASVIPRSRSQPTLNASIDRTAALVKETQHQRTASLDSSLSTSTTQAVPRPSTDDPRRDSPSTERVTRASTPPASSTPAAGPAVANTATPSAPAPPPKAAIREVTPLHPGPITAATNIPPNHPSATAEKPKASGGLKSRLAKALHKDKVARESGVVAGPKMSSASPSPMSSPVKAPHPPYPHTSPSEASTRSGTPPRTPPQDLHPPSAPFAIHTRAMDSEVSLAETGRTERVEDEKKSRKGLFRMKNMSTDNISLSSTVSSASMMIRKMGSIGKLARRNSLMGISKIFKDKSKDEDAALPEVDGKKKDKKEKKAKKQQGKGELAPVEIVRASAEADDDDRALAGLSPAAKLARQHTLKSKADEAKRLSQVSEVGQTLGVSGEPTWDNNTVTTVRPSHLPSLGSVLPPPASAPPGVGAPEVMHVQPRTVSVHHAVAVSEAEYDSDDDSSDGETIEDVADRFGRTGLNTSDQADQEFRSIWGNSYIDKGAVPKKGILKSSASFCGTATPRSPSALSHRTVLAERPPNGSTPPSAPRTLTPTPNQGAKSRHPEFDFSFDTPSPSLELYHPNTSLPALPASPPSAGADRHLAVRSMTSPIPSNKRILWAPDCAVYTTYDAGTYDRRSEVATCNRLTPELALSIKQE